MTKLKRIRLEQGLSQSQLALKSNVNVRMIQHYEQSTKDINKANAIVVLRIAEALGVNIKDILEEEKED